MSKILVSGVKPTGRPHIGNYFGAMKQFVDLQDSYESRIFVANLHALTTLQNKEEMLANSRDVVLDYLAIGIDPEKTTLYYQSDVPHVAELSWIFSCLTTVPYLARAHAFKAAVDKFASMNAKTKALKAKMDELTEVNVGTFNYPLLMAADILAANADVVPVGKDQVQHIEIAREVARDFNNTFGETFAEPKELIIEETETVPGTDGQKMSKSYNNTIPLFASDEEIEKAVMSIVTDSSGDKPVNVYAIHSLIRDKESLDVLYEEKKGRYKDLKDALIADLKAFIGPMRERRAEWEAKPDEVERIMEEGGKKMRAIIHEKMKEVREKVGFIHHE